MITYAEARAALDARGPGRMVPDRCRITSLLQYLGEPQRSYQSVHITGTNGKTSTARMTDALLREVGVRSGYYTSPHLVSVRERIGLHGRSLDEEAFARAYEDIAPYLDLVDEASPDPVTYFEALTAMALAAFADAPVDAAVVEVGLGGRWDATNVLQARVAAVLPISLDHTELLGTQLREIASEKAEIITQGATAILAAQQPEVASVLLRRCAQVDAAVAREGMEFGVLERRPAVGGQLIRLRGLGADYDEIFLPLHGAHQAANAAVALAAAEAFLGAGRERSLPEYAVRQAFAGVTAPGRLERVRHSPTILIDAAHNPAGAAVTATALAEEFAFRRLVAVVGVLSDKDVRGILAALEPVVDLVVCTANRSERALPAPQLAELATAVFGPERVSVAPVLSEAIDAAVALLDESVDQGLSGQGVLVTGSVVTAGEARALLMGGTP